MTAQLSQVLIFVLILLSSRLNTSHGFINSLQFGSSQSSKRPFQSIPRAITYSIGNHGNLLPCKPARSTYLLHASAVIEQNDKLPPTVLPILLSVLALIVSEGIALSTLPLHLQSMGATPALVGLSTSAFSIAQMVCCPLIVQFSSRKGRRRTLGLCLAGAAISSGVISFANSINIIIAARFLAGAFAAAIPVAQAGVADLVPPHQTVIALSRVSAASQTGLVIGPIASAILQGIFSRCGIKSTVRGVFATSALFALVVLGIGGAGSDAPTTAEKPNKETTKENKNAEVIIDSSSNPPKYAQPLLRIIALAAGWAMTLSVSTYSLFSSRFLGYGQPQLSAAMSAGAATTILTQMFIVPGLVQSAGEHLACTLGLCTLTMGLAGSSLLRSQPIHFMVYLLIRVGTGITDTATATLVARNSRGRDERANNLGMIQSTRAGSRIFTPVISGSLFSRSCLQQFPLPGSLPYLVNACLALLLTPLPMLLKRMETERSSSTLSKSD